MLVGVGGKDRALTGVLKGEGHHPRTNLWRHPVNRRLLIIGTAVAAVIVVVVLLATSVGGGGGGLGY